MKGWQRRISPGCETGFSMISLVAALVLVGLLYAGYLKLGSGAEGVTRGAPAAGAGRAVACQMNRQALERALLSWSVSHPGTEPTLDALQADGVSVNPCPEGGRFTLLGHKVSCSVHSE